MKPTWDPRAVACFELVFRPFLASRLRVRLRAVPNADPGRSRVLFANHHSWWDGFLLRELHRRTWAGPLWTVMLERELAPRPWFRRLGCLGVDPAEPASVRHLARSLEAIAKGPAGWSLAWFPQGRIWPATRRPMGLRSGLARLAPCLGEVRMFPVALRTEPLNTLRPHAFVSPGKPLGGSGPWATGVLEDALAAELDRLDQELSDMGEDASVHWPGERR